MRMNDSIAKVRNRSLVGACAAINVIVDGILGASLCVEVDLVDGRCGYLLINTKKPPFAQYVFKRA